MEDGIAEVARLSVNRGWKWKPMGRDSQQRFDVLVIGGGPAGMAAAVRAAEFGARVGMVDENATAGGQIWRHAVCDWAGSFPPTWNSPGRWRCVSTSR